MCGIAGILKVWTPAERELALRTPHAQSIPEPWLDILDDSIKHRGPDGHGRFRDRAIRDDGSVVDVALVHRRLSIIDHAGGHQPMVLRVPKGAPSASSGGSRPIPGRLLSPEELESHNRRILADAHSASREITSGTNPERALGALSHDHIAVVFNGCIYNHRELRTELQKAGHAFGTDHSDTEVLVHGWREWGAGKLIQQELLPLRSEGLCSRLEDMFALAVWDASAATLTLARDRFGQKPLYVAPLPRQGSWAFSSTVPGLLKLIREQGGSLDVDTAILHHWIRFGCALDPPVKKVSAVPISTTVTFPANEVVPERFEVPEFFGRFWVGPFADIAMGGRSKTLGAAAVEDSLRSAVIERLESDVPLGCFLSGGVDSSLIAAFAGEVRDDLRTFSVRMPDPAMDESSFAEQVAAHIGSRHATLDCAPNPAADLVSAIGDLGLPFGDSSLLPARWVSRATRREVAVALSGDGGDELFGGYERYRAAAILERWRWPLALVPVGAKAAPKSDQSRLARLADAARHGGYEDLVSIFPLSTMREVVPRLPRSTFRRDIHTAPLGAAGAMDDDLDSYLPNDLLRKTDSASMSVALEVRCPFLAPGVAGPASRAMTSSLMPHGQRKGLLRQVARKYLPAEIVDRPKMGFAIPIGEWFRSDYGGLRTMLLDHLNSTEPFGPRSLGIDLNMKFIRQMLDEHLGTGPSGQVKRDHSQRLYLLLVLSIWAKWLGGLRAGS